MQNIITPTKEKYERFNESYKAYYPAAFFILGFIFDVLTLDRIDNWFSILQQAVYLLITSRLLYLRQLEIAGLFQPGPKIAKIWRYQNEALHFVLGSLLSTFTLFYFVSSSLSSSLVFMLIMGLVLVINELPRFQEARLQTKIAIYALCLFSYLSYLIPIIVGFIGLVPLLITLVLCAMVFWTSTQQLIKKGIIKDQAFKDQLYPSSGVLVVLLLLYFLKLLPPIPLAVQYAGVYHNIEKQNGQFLLTYERPFWKFWQNGAQSFMAQEGDRVYVFARIFSPAYFADEVVFHWLQKINGEWRTSDKVPVKVSGGRDQGFRAYSSKSNYQEGEWVVKIETSDGREIGRISFDIQTSNNKLPVQERPFKQDIQ